MFVSRHKCFDIEDHVTTFSVSPYIEYIMSLMGLAFFVEAPKPKVIILVKKE